MKPWTHAEHRHLQMHYVVDGAAKCAADLGRTSFSVKRQAQRLGLIRVRRWSSHDDARLMVLWGVHPLSSIATTLGRTEDAIYWRARELQLGLGCPQGHEYLSRAAQRTGYATRSLRMILRWARVPIERATTRPGVQARSNHVTHVVEPSDVDEAVARWCATEPLEQAAERRGVASCVLARLLAAASAAGDDRIPEKPRSKRHWRIPTVVLDEVLQEHLRRESLAAAAMRVGVDRRTLHGWLAAAGITVVRGVKLERDAVTAVVEQRLSDPRCRSPRRAA